LIPEIKPVKSLQSISYGVYHPRKLLIPKIKPKKGRGYPTAEQATFIRWPAFYAYTLTPVFSDLYL
jgi:hypothetical protein